MYQAASGAGVHTDRQACHCDDEIVAIVNITLLERGCKVPCSCLCNRAFPLYFTCFLYGQASAKSCRSCLLVMSVMHVYPSSTEGCFLCHNHLICAVTGAFSCSHIQGQEGRQYQLRSTATRHGRALGLSGTPPSECCTQRLLHVTKGVKAVEQPTGAAEGRVPSEGASQARRHHWP
jgi:hypothetical protein